MAKITYDDKVAINPQPEVANQNKVTDSDMNEIKNSVNTLYNGVNAITISLSSNQSASIPSGYGASPINFDTQIAKVGNALTFDSANHWITIGSGINHIEVNSNIVIANGSNSYGDRYLNIVKRVNNTNSTIAQTYYLNSIATNNHYPLTVSGVIIPVNENDKILCNVSSAITETISIKGGSAPRSYLTIKVID